MADAQVFPVLPEPIQDPTAGVPYAGMLVWLSFSPRIVGETVDATANVRAVPYKLIRGHGVVEAPEYMHRSLSVGSVLEARDTDPHLARVIDAISGALQAYISGA
jgi:hypothetical protein